MHDRIGPTAQTVFAASAALCGINGAVSPAFIEALRTPPPLAAPPLCLLTGHEAVVAAEKMARGVLERVMRQVTVGGRPKTVLVAGGGHFTSLWARDMSFGGHGLLWGDPDDPALAAVRGSLEALLECQRADGLLPRRLGGWANAALQAVGAFGVHLPERHEYRHVDYVDGQGKTPIDTNALVVIASGDYFRGSNDVDFLQRYRAHLTRALGWLQAQTDEGGLVRQAPSADWKDMVARGGVVTYTNMLYLRATAVMIRVERTLGNDDAAAAHEREALRILDAIMARLWNAQTGCFRDTESIDALSADGNILGLLWARTTPSQSASIFAALERLRAVSPIAMAAGEQPYPRGMISRELRLAGIASYHDLMVWPWQGAIYAIAAMRHGRLELAHEVLGQMARAALIDRSFYEVYWPGPLPRPTHTWLYSSEHDFLWSAGTFAWAVRELRRIVGLTV